MGHSKFNTFKAKQYTVYKQKTILNTNAKFGYKTLVFCIKSPKH